MLRSQWPFARDILRLFLPFFLFSILVYFCLFLSYRHPHHNYICKNFERKKEEKTQTIITRWDTSVHLISILIWFLSLLSIQINWRVMDTNNKTTFSSFFLLSSSLNSVYSLFSKFFQLWLSFLSLSLQRGKEEGMKRKTLSWPPTGHWIFNDFFLSLSFLSFS